eukprot:150640-Pelagomonas_calceolata.AAC.3
MAGQSLSHHEATPFHQSKCMRLECYQCSSPRPAVPKRVQMDTEGPSTILKGMSTKFNFLYYWFHCSPQPWRISEATDTVNNWDYNKTEAAQVSGLGEDATEEGLRFMFSVHMPVLDVRLVRDKFSGAPRGFAFVELGSIADATRALNQLQDLEDPISVPPCPWLQNFVPEFQTTPIRLCYARDRGGGQPAASSAALPFEAVQVGSKLVFCFVLAHRQVVYIPSIPPRQAQNGIWDVQRSCVAFLLNRLDPCCFTALHGAGGTHSNLSLLPGLQCSDWPVGLAGMGCYECDPAAFGAALQGKVDKLHQAMHLHSCGCTCATLLHCVFHLLLNLCAQRRPKSTSLQMCPQSVLARQLWQLAHGTRGAKDEWFGPPTKA